MSYILDALRKSDAQRRCGAVPTLASIPIAATVPERPALHFPAWSALILIGVAGTAIAWLRPWSPEPAAVVVATTTPLVARQVVPAPAPRALAPPEPDVSRQEALSVTVSPVVESPAPRRKPATASGTALRSLPVVAARPRQDADGVRDEAAGAARPDPAAPPQAMASADLPAAVRQQLPTLSVAVHAYSANPRDRLVSINGRMLREGDSLTPDLRLEQITPDGMIFAYRGYRFRRSAQ